MRLCKVVGMLMQARLFVMRGSMYKYPDSQESSSELICASLLRLIEGGLIDYLGECKPATYITPFATSFPTMRGNLDT